MLRPTALFALLAICFGSQGASAGKPQLRPPTDLERSYVGLAVDLAEAAICEKISPSARQFISSNPRGSQVFFTRSLCFQYLAHKTDDKALCSNVETAGATWFASGASISRAACERLVTTGIPFTSRLGFDQRLVLKSAGYEAETDTAEAWSALYESVVQGTGSDPAEEFVQRLPEFRD